MSPQTKHLMSGHQDVLQGRATKIQVKLYNVASSAVAGDHLEDKCLRPGERHPKMSVSGGLDSFYSISDTANGSSRIPLVCHYLGQ